MSVPYQQRGHVLKLFAAALGLIALLILFYQPRWALRRLGGRSSGILWFVETDRAVMALTIDDGPNPAGTPAILDVLARHHAKATFFLLAGNIRGHEDLVHRLVAEGHEIGNHMIRDEPSRRLDRDEFERQFLEADEALRPFVPTASRVGQADAERPLSTRWFRPVSGFTNPPMMEVIGRHGATCVLGSLYPYDPHIPSPHYAALQIRANVRAGEIVILHDGTQRGPRTARTLEWVLPELGRKGFRLVTLSELWNARAKQTID